MREILPILPIITSHVRRGDPIKRLHYFCFHFIQLFLSRAVPVIIHFLHRIPPDGTFSVIPAVTDIARFPREKMPVQMTVSVSEQLTVHFLRVKSFCDRLADNRHFFQKPHLGITVKFMQLP